MLGSFSTLRGSGLRARPRARISTFGGPSGKFPGSELLAHSPVSEWPKITGPICARAINLMIKNELGGRWHHDWPVMPTIHSELATSNRPSACPSRYSPKIVVCTR